MLIVARFILDKVSLCMYTTFTLLKWALTSRAEQELAIPGCVSSICHISELIYAQNAQLVSDVLLPHDLDLPMLGPQFVMLHDDQLTTFNVKAGILT